MSRSRPLLIVRRAVAIFVSRAGGLVLLLAAWIAVTYGGLVDPQTLPSPTELLQHARLLATQGYRGVGLGTHVLASVVRTLAGFLCAVAIGIPVGLGMARFKWLDATIGPIVAFVRPIPPIAFIPLAVLYLGLGELAKIVLIFTAAFMFVVLNAEAGYRSVPVLLLRAGQMLGYSQRRLFTHVILPASLPNVMAGVRTALAVSWALVVAAELIAAQQGLGYMVSSAGNFADLRTVYVGIIIIGVIGFILDWCARRVERRLLHWQGR
jgi:ABC-type nitrate/sulfonate/bicarbonate transport system permease component